MSSREALIRTGWVEQPDGSWYWPPTGRYVDPTGTYYLETVDPPSQPTTQPSPTTSTSTTSTTTTSTSLPVEQQMQKPAGTYSDSTTEAYIRNLLTQSGGDLSAVERIVREVNSGQRTLANVQYWTTGAGGQSTGGGGAGYTTSSGSGTSSGSTGGSGGGSTTLPPAQQMGQPGGTYTNNVTRQQVYNLLVNQPGGYTGGESIDTATDRIYAQLVAGTRSWASVLYWVNEWEGEYNPDAPPEFGGMGDPSPAPPAAGNTAGGAPGVWRGGQLYRVSRDNAEDLWVMVYEWNGHQVAWQWDSEEQMMAQTGGPQYVGGYSVMSWTQFSNLSVAEGPPPSGSGSFQAWVNQTIQGAAIDAGIGDPTLWGQYMADPQIQDLIFQASIGEWSSGRLTAEIRKTDFYQNVLYPGITNFFNSDNPEAEWYQYFANVRPVLEALGVSAGNDNYRGVVGDMLRSGVSDQAFINMSGIFQRAKTSEAYATVLNEWTQRELGKELDFDTWYDVIAGESEADMRDVVNKATLAYQNEQVQAKLSAEQIERVAERRPALTDAEVSGFLRDYLASVQSVTGIMGRYGLTSDEILSASAGIETQSGRSLEEIQRLTRQAAGEAGRLDDQKIQFFLDFTPMGTPRRPGLSALAPESG